MTESGSLFEWEVKHGAPAAPVAARHLSIPTLGLSAPAVAVRQVEFDTPKKLAAHDCAYRRRRPSARSREYC